MSVEEPAMHQSANTRIILPWPYFDLSFIAETYVFGASAAKINIFGPEKKIDLDFFKLFQKGAFGIRGVTFTKSTFFVG